MGEYVMKDKPDGEVYIVWHTGNQGLVRYGTRDEVRGYLLAEYGRQGRPDDVLEHADEHGTSIRARIAAGPLPGSWTDPKIECRELYPDGPIGWLPRERLVDYAQALVDRKDVAAAGAMLQPFDDE